MKRIANLMPLIADYDNLWLAAWKSRRNKQQAKDTLRFTQRDFHQAIEEIRNRLLYYGYAEKPKPYSVRYRFFTVHEPKKRLICASPFEERILQHAMLNICAKFFDEYQISDSYACRKGLGQYKALEKAIKNHPKNKYFLKMDVKKYFDSINHETLKMLLARVFKDSAVLKVFGGIIDSYSASRGCGMPIGNLTSQYFANHYLAFADHFVREQLHVKCYVRYMDDMVMWGNDKQQLLAHGKALKDFLAERLQLNLKPFCLNSTETGLPFLGYRLLAQRQTHNCRVTLTKPSKSRFKRKMNMYDHNLNIGLWTQEEYVAHVLPLCAFADKAKFYSAPSYIPLSIAMSPQETDYPPAGFTLNNTVK